jgi:hypothetical protein
MKMNKRKSILLGAFLLLLSGTALAVLPPRISWNPSTLNPASIAPGTTASFQLTLTHTGILPIPATNQLRIVAEGAVVPFVTVTQPTFPPVIKRGNQVRVNITVSVPQGTPLSVVKGNLTLKRVLPNGKVKEVWRADALPVELTFSSFFIPPAPDKTLDEATIEGVDTNGNGVRDRTERYIGFTYPNSEKLQMGLMQDARVYEAILRDSGDKAATRGHAEEQSDYLYCLTYLLNDDLDMLDKITDELKANFILDTAERIRANHNANAQFGGMVSGGRYLPLNERNIRCSFNPDTLPN